LDFEKDFPDARVIKLEQNYRSTQTILDAANALIAQNRRQMSKHLWTDEGQGDKIKVRQLEDEHAEARFVAGEIERLVDSGTSRDEVAVFYRTNAQSRVLEDTLVNYNVDYQVIGGTKFYERAEIKDAISYLTLLVNPADTIAFQRVVNSPRRGIGNTTQARLISHANSTGESIWDVALAPEDVPGLGAAAIKAVGRFMSTMERLRERLESASVGDLIQEMLSETGYMDALRAERTIEAQGRMENLEELVGIGREFEQGQQEEKTLEAFLERIALVADTDSLSSDEGVLTLMTMHNAKGLEYPIVFMIGMEEGVFPHMRSIEAGDVEEERRLAYVGVTRAMRELYLTYAEQRSLFGQWGANVKSRFLDEIPEDLCEIVAQERRKSWSSWDRGGGSSASWGSGGGGGAGRFGRGRGSTDPPAKQQRPQPTPGKSYSVGEDVVHPTMGEGVVIGVEPAGLIVVRFASDGSERKLMADYAPLEKR
jgi:DNA helicase-2/ATP-dependent DNA helicase PcrA